MPKCLSKFNTLHFAQFMSQVIMGNSMSKKINNACEKHQKIFRSPKYLCSIYMCFRFIQLLFFWLFEHNLQNVLSKPSTQSEYKFKGEEALNLICSLSTVSDPSWCPFTSNYQNGLNSSFIYKKYYKLANIKRWDFHSLPSG